MVVVFLPDDDGEPLGGLLGPLLRVRLDHDPHDGLGAGLAQEDPPFAGEGGLLRRHGRADSLVALDAVAPA